MKYAIYDKAADGYLTKMEFDFDTPDNQMLTSTGYTEYITDAQLLDTKESAIDVITRIESCKFMEKGRFVIHSFDDTLKEQYIISEAGTPTKVIDSITVDLDGTINVKYGTMACHWSTASLDYAITRMNALQKAKSPIYTAWCNTFDIYKVIPVIDERSCNHYQFINVTTKGLEEYAKNEVDPLNKRIEELEKANYKINKSFAEHAVVCAELRVKNTNLTNKVESIKKEASDWKKMCESAVEHREALKNVIDTIYTDLKSANAYCDKSYRLKAALNAFKHDDALNHIPMPTEVYYVQENGVCLTAKDEVCAIIDQILTIMDSRERLSKKYDAYALKAIAMNKELSDAADSLEEVNDKNEELANMLKEITSYVADIMLATRTTDHNKMISDLTDVSLKIGVKTMDDGPMYGISVILTMLIRILKERNSLFALKDHYKRISNSIYGISIPGRCCGKQMTADVITGKKILVDKEKYDDLMECVNNISLTYEMMNLTPFSMDRPSWLSGIINRINNLAK